MTSVYVVEGGEDYEGGHVVGLFDSYAKALRCIRQETDERVMLEYPWTRKGENYWHRGCDWLSITEYSVE